VREHDIFIRVGNNGGNGGTNNEEEIINICRYYFSMVKNGLVLVVEYEVGVGKNTGTVKNSIRRYI
jgi:hypothetical protein